jgi:O-antigen ligase
MPESNHRIIDHILFALYMVFFVSLIFSFRAISSISVPLILVAGVVKNGIERKAIFHRNLINPFFISCCLFFLLQLVSLTYTSDLHQAWGNIFLKSALVAFPVALGCCDYVNEETRKKLLKWFCLILFVACIFAIYKAFQNYSATHDTSVFLYHSLVRVYSGHAVQFSILVFVAILYLFETLIRKEILFHKYFHIFLVLFFLLFLFLLSSKLVIAFFLLYFFYTMIRSFLTESVSKVSVIISIIGSIIFFLVVFFTRNRISNRFREIGQTDFQFIEREKFSPADYFNGLQFRLLQWRFVPEILSEHKAWLNGVSIGDAQSLLNQKYISENMYTGGASGRSDKGFIGYNAHNEFLQALLQSGLIGALAFLFLMGSLIKMAWKRKKAELSFVIILLLIYSFSESVFESQYSLFIFLFFPLFFYLGNNKKKVETNF